MSEPTILLLPSSDITSTILTSAATFFTSNYGIWGPSSPSPGSRVRMSPQYLRSQLLPPSDTIFVRLSSPSTILGHVIATRFQTSTKRTAVWITQLVVSTSHRNQGVAKRLLQAVKQHWPALDKEEGIRYGILSSHPFAIAAFLRVFDHGVSDADFQTTRTEARELMAACPIPYVAGAKLRGSIFEHAGDAGDEARSVSCANTGFLVDHFEPDDALERLRREGKEWKFGALPEGCEYLIVVKGDPAET